MTSAKMFMTPFKHIIYVLLWIITIPATLIRVRDFWRLEDPRPRQLQSHLTASYYHLRAKALQKFRDYHQLKGGGGQWLSHCSPPRAWR